MRLFRIGSLLIIAAAALCYLDVAQAAVPLSDFFAYGISAGDMLLPAGDDSSSPKIPIYPSVKLPFVQRNNSEVVMYVNVNGGVSFGQTIPTFSAYCGASETMTKLVAPFWADIKTDNNLGGSVFYRQSMDNATLAKATQEILAAYPEFWDLKVKWVFIATWVDVTFYSDKPCLLNITRPRNTFQVAIATDGYYSFALMYYNKITWTSGQASEGDECTGLGGFPAKAGVDAGDGVNFHSVLGSCTDDIVHIDDTSNVNVPGKWVFRFDEPEVIINCGGKTRIYPTSVDAFGYMPVTFVGPCLHSEENQIDVQFSCIFHDPAQEPMCVPAEVDTSIGVPAFKCKVPQLYSSGIIDVELDIVTQYHTYNLTEILNLMNASDFTDLLNITELIDVISLTELETLLNVTDLENLEDISIADLLEVLEEVLNHTEISNGTKLFDLIELLNSTYLVELSYPAKLAIHWQSGQLRVLTQAISEDKVNLTVHWNNEDRILNGISHVNLMILVFDGNRTWNPLSTIAENLCNTGSLNLLINPNDILQPLKILAMSAVSFAIVPQNASGWLVGKPMSGALLMPQKFDFAPLCQSWYDGAAIPADLPSCPPLLSQAQADPSFAYESDLDLKKYHNGAVASYRSIQPTKTGASQQCVYDSEGFIMVGSPNGGSTAMYSPAFDYSKHIAHDDVPWHVCCHPKNKRSCAMYYDKRPSDAGAYYSAPETAMAYGDPHFITFDKMKYTFNAVGEFWLIRPLKYVDESTDGFRMQARMQEIVNGVDKASVFSAFVAQYDNGSVVQVQLSADPTTTLNVLIDDVKLSFDSGDLTRNFDRVVVSADSKYVKTVLVTFPSFAFRFAGANDAISVVATADPLELNAYFGLFGTFDGDASNDLKPPQGNHIRNTSDLAAIHDEFGEKWIISSNQSLFTYGTSQSFNSLYKPDFSPNLQYPKVEDLNKEVVNICKSSRECMFDYEVTKNLDFARQTAGELAYFTDINNALEAQVIMCPPLTRPANGYFRTTNFFDSSMVTFECFSGYTLEGTNPLKCQNGTWSGAVPTCRKTEGGGDDYEDNVTNKPNGATKNTPAIFALLIGFTIIFKQFIN